MAAWGHEAVDPRWHFGMHFGSLYGLVEVPIHNSFFRGCPQIAAQDLTPEFAEDCRATSCLEHEDAALLQAADLKPRGKKLGHTKDKTVKKPGYTKDKTPADSSYKITTPGKKLGHTKDKKAKTPCDTKDKTPADSSYKITTPGKKLGHMKDKKAKTPGYTKDKTATPGKKLGHTKDKKVKTPGYPKDKSATPGKKLGHTKGKKGKKLGHTKGKKPAYHKTPAKARMSMHLGLTAQGCCKLGPISEFLGSGSSRSWFRSPF